MARALSAEETETERENLRSDCETHLEREGERGRERERVCAALTVTSETHLGRKREGLRSDTVRLIWGGGGGDRQTETDRDSLRRSDTVRLIWRAGGGGGDRQTDRDS